MLAIELPIVSLLDLDKQVARQRHRFVAAQFGIPQCRVAVALNGPHEIAELRSVELVGRVPDAETTQCHRNSPAEFCRTLALADWRHHPKLGKLRNAFSQCAGLRSVQRPICGRSFRRRLSGLPSAGAPANLAVAYDATPGAGLGRNDLQRRPRSMWRRNALLPAAAGDAVSLGEGDTPLLEAPNLGLGDVWIRISRAIRPGRSRTGSPRAR